VLRLLTIVDDAIGRRCHSDCCHAWTGEKTGEDAAAGSAVKDIIASFSVDSALVPVGGVVELRCRVTSIQGHLVRLYKSIPGTTDLELLTTNRVKENSISDIDRYSIDAEEYSSHGYDFIFRITGSMTPSRTIKLLAFINSIFYVENWGSYATLRYDCSVIA